MAPSPGTPADGDPRLRPAGPGEKLSTYWSNPDPNPLAAKGYRDYVEELIQEAMAQGKFANLPGRGRPLNLEQDPHEQDWLVHHILKNANVLPEWAELRQAIQGDLAWLRAHPDHPDRWERIQVLNRRIDRYNLLVPSLDLKLPRFTPETAPGGRRPPAGDPS